MISTRDLPNGGLTIIIVTFQSSRTICKTLETIVDMQSRRGIEIIVIDNASTDNTVALIKSGYPSVKIIDSKVNLGFGKGCNVGIELVKTPYFLLLNPDAVIDEKSLYLLIDFMENNPRAGICGPAVIDDSGDLQPSGNIPKPWKVLIRPMFPGFVSKGQNYVKPGDKPEKTDWLCGSVLMIRKSLIDSIGGFDPRFFLYFEETDLILRSMNEGWEIWTVGEAVAGHVNAASAKQTKEDMMGGTISRHYYRSRYYYMVKHYGILAAFGAEIGELIFMFFRLLVNVVRRRSYDTLQKRLKAPLLKMPEKSGILYE